MFVVPLFVVPAGRYDAFETTLEILRAHIDTPGAPPQDLQKVRAHRNPVAGRGRLCHAHIFIPKAQNAIFLNFPTWVSLF